MRSLSFQGFLFTAFCTRLYIKVDLEWTLTGRGADPEWATGYSLGVAGWFERESRPELASFGFCLGSSAPLLFDGGGQRLILSGLDCPKEAGVSVSLENPFAQCFAVEPDRVVGNAAEYGA